MTGKYICPNDILLGRAFIQKIVDEFWRKWARDVLPTLVPRKKWTVERRNVQVGDVVILEDANVVRGVWKLGRIVETYTADGLVRSVLVRTSTGEYKRPITKIAVICPVEDNTYEHLLHMRTL